MANVSRTQWSNCYYPCNVGHHHRRIFYTKSSLCFLNAARNLTFFLFWIVRARSVMPGFSNSMLETSTPSYMKNKSTFRPLSLTSLNSAVLRWRIILDDSKAFSPLDNRETTKLIRFYKQGIRCIPACLYLHVQGQLVYHDREYPHPDLQTVAYRRWGLAEKGLKCKLTSKNKAVS